MAQNVPPVRYTRDNFDVSSFPTNRLYEAANAYNPAIHHVPDVPWDDAEFGKVLIWSNISLDDAQVETIGAIWLASINANTISVRTAAQGLRLASSLRSMNPGDRKLLLTPQERPAIASLTHHAAVDMPAIDSFTDTPFTLRNQQVVVAPEADNNPVVPVAAPAVGVNLNAQPDSAQKRRDSYCFLAAYLMRMLVKSADNTVLGVANMKIRYESFYEASRTVAGFTLTTQQAVAYKEALINQARVGLSYTHSVANTHQYHLGTMDPKEAGVLSYLCFLPFSYTGMHAYTLLMELKHLTKMEAGHLLSLFHADITAPALTKIRNIITNQERNDAEPDKSLIFRYSTMWDAKYYNSLRSRQCTHLVYIVLHAWKMVAVNQERADPEQIVAVGGLSDAMKAVLKKVGMLIGDSLNKKILGGQGNAPAFQIILDEEKAGPEVVVQDEEDDWNGY